MTCGLYHFEQRGVPFDTSEEVMFHGRPGLYHFEQRDGPFNASEEVIFHGRPVSPISRKTCGTTAVTQTYAGPLDIMPIPKDRYVPDRYGPN